MNSDNTPIQQVLEEFLNSKKSESTKRYVYQIFDFLNQASEPVRAKELESAFVPEVIPHVGTYFRLLNGLVDFGLIERITEDHKPGERGRAPTYYRVPPGLSRLPSWEEVSERNTRCIYALKILVGRLSAAYELMEEAGIPDPDTAVNARYNEILSGVDLTAFSYSDEELKKWSVGSFGITRLYPSITLIPPVREL